MKYSYTYNNEIYTVDIEQDRDGTYSATIGDHSYTVSMKSGNDSGFILTLNNVQSHIYTASEDDNRYLYVDGQNYALTVENERSSRRRSSGGQAGSLTAQMPGQVTEVHVNEGDQVESGQTLVILEAMKMEIRITTPTDGTVKQILVSKGDVVKRGQLLVELLSVDTP